MPVGVPSVGVMTAGKTSPSTSFQRNSAGSGAPADAVLASDAAACASRGYEVQQLAARMAACADRADAALARLVRVELQGWQSPAGRTYRTSLSLQAAALSRSRTGLQEAVAAVLRHAQNVAMSPGRPGY